MAASFSTFVVHVCANGDDSAAAEWTKRKLKRGFIEALSHNAAARVCSYINSTNKDICMCVVCVGGCWMGWSPSPGEGEWGVWGWGLMLKVIWVGQRYHKTEEWV